MNGMEKQQQVWQRVLAGQERAAAQSLGQLRREAMELTALYQNLSTVLAGRAKELVQQLYAGEKANADALAGIMVLSHQAGEVLKRWQPGREAPGKVLEKCYHRSRRCMGEYLARSAEGEFGIVYEKMARREGAQCALLAELLGILK